MKPKSLKTSPQTKEGACDSRFESHHKPAPSERKPWKPNNNFGSLPADVPFKKAQEGNGWKKNAHTLIKL
jgi:hypothetical protein